MKKLSIIQLFLIIFVSQLCVSQNKHEIKVSAEKITDNIYMLSGAGGNIGLFVGEDGSLVIDTQFPQCFKSIKRSIDSLGIWPVKYVLNTNFHYDHVSGNQLFAESGAIIIAHNMVREYMKYEWRIPELYGPDWKLDPYPEIAWPVFTVDKGYHLHLIDEIIEVSHIPNAHSDCDLVYYFTKQNVMHTGDILIPDGFTFINISNGGSIGGLIHAIDTILTMTNEQTRFIPGHGKIQSYDEVKAHRNCLNKYMQAMQILIDEGKSLDDIKENPPVYTYYINKEQPAIDEIKFFAELIYYDLTGFYR